MSVHNTCGDDFSTNEELQSFKNDLAEEFNDLTQAFSTKINSFKSDI